eukprot:TRINITY_DN7859_c1_g1_i1.p1 TRINITY_DN7859_c1_g1~~TRINITY_DN7859_c1_g1_i1.p1  ORF type:complete len:289 (-),score=24.47 TRINITY_DN7859_c1_g1_i1:86-859(-)
MLRPCCTSIDAVADNMHASTAGHGIVRQRGLFSNLFQAFAEITEDFLETLDVHVAEHIDTVSVCATASALLTPTCGMASHGAATHALVSQASTEILSLESTVVLSATLTAVSVGRFLCSDWMQSCHGRTLLLKASEQICQGLHGHWERTIRTWASLPQLEDCVGRSSVLAFSKDVAAKEPVQTEASDGTEVPERRVDPVDGGIYTYEQIASFYRTLYRVWEIKDYWENVCRPVRGRHGQALPQTIAGRKQPCRQGVD